MEDFGWQFAARFLLEKSSRHMRAINLIIPGLALLLTSGCVTSATVHAAKGGPYWDKKGDEHDRKPQAAYYLLLPFTIPVDVAGAPIEYYRALGDPGHW